MGLEKNLIFEQVAVFCPLCLPWHSLVLWQHDVLFRDLILCSDVIAQSDKSSGDYSCENLFHCVSQIIVILRNEMELGESVCVRIVRDLVSPIWRTSPGLFSQRPELPVMPLSMDVNDYH